jgi:hypothetical protein
MATDLEEPSVEVWGAEVFADIKSTREEDDCMRIVRIDRVGVSADVHLERTDLPGAKKV